LTTWRGCLKPGGDVVFGESDFTEKKDPKRIQENYIYMLYKMETVWKDVQTYNININSNCVYIYI